MIKRFLTAALAIAALSGSVLAQTVKTSPVWWSQSKLSSPISVTGTSAPTQLPTPGQVAWICNTGSNDAYLAFGSTNSVVATVAGSSWLKAGTCGAYDLQPGAGNSYAYMAAITASSTTSLNVEAGIGSPPSQIGGAGAAQTVNQGTSPWATQDATASTNTGAPGATACATDTGSCSLNALLQRIAQRVTSAITGTTTTGIVSNPTSTLTSGTATAIVSGSLIASSTTAGLIVVPSYTSALSANGANQFQWRLTTPRASGWGIPVTINFWSAAPTYTNGDGGAYAVATGGAGWLGSCTMTLTQFGDAATGQCAPNVGNFIPVGLTSVFWDLQANASATKTSGQTFTLTPETVN